MTKNRDTTVTDKNGRFVEVFKDTDRRFFGIRYQEDNKSVGRTAFLDTRGNEKTPGGERIFYHTEIGKEYGGAGLASVLIKHAVHITTEEEREIVAVCPFVKSWLEKHGEDITWRNPTPDDQKALQQALT